MLLDGNAPATSSGAVLKPTTNYQRIAQAQVSGDNRLVPRQRGARRRCCETVNAPSTTSRAMLGSAVNYQRIAQTHGVPRDNH